MDTKNYNRATAYFRKMEIIEPQDKKWGEFADAMDEVISTCVPVVRCKDCRWHENNTGECSNIDSICWRNGCARDDFYCAEGERK